MFIVVSAPTAGCEIKNGYVFWIHGFKVKNCTHLRSIRGPEVAVGGEGGVFIFFTTSSPDRITDWVTWRAGISAGFCGRAVTAIMARNPPPEMQTPAHDVRAQ